MVNYREAIIYKLCCLDPSITNIYIGSTTCFKKRKNYHKSGCNNPNIPSYNYYVYQFIREHGGFQNWEMILIEQYEATSKKHLEMRERYWLDELKASLNIQTPARTEQELKEINNKREKIRREQNIEHFKEKDKIFYEKNKDRINEKCKNYREQNREFIRERDKELYKRDKELYKQRKSVKIKCECGSTISKGNLSTHIKTPKHLNSLLHD